MKLVILESPYAGDIDTNRKYARVCMRDSIDRGEAPFASHLLYTQPGILKDDKPQERSLGISCGFEWGMHAEKIVVYTDQGISGGMLKAIGLYAAIPKPIEYRSLGDDWEEKQ